MSVNQKVYATLVAMGSRVATGENAKRQAKTEIGGAYDQGILAASQSANKAEFEEAFEALESNIQYGRDGLHEMFGAEKRTREDKKRGRLYKLPQSISNVKTLVLAAFDRHVPFTLKNEKTGKQEVRPYNAIQKEVQAAKDRASAEEAKKLTGRPRLDWDVRALLAKAGEALAKMDDSQAKALHDALASCIVPQATATVTPIVQSPAQVLESAATPVAAPRKRQSRKAA